MTQAFNLSQLANNVNSIGLLNAAAGLYNQLPVANGGTGAATLAANAVLLGNGTSALQTVAAGTSGNVLTSNGTTWTSGASGGAVPVYNVFTTPGTWTKPATIKGIMVTVIGGGGNGGNATLVNAAPNAATGGGGGGGGASIRVYPAPSIPGPQPYTVGVAASSSSFGVAPITVITATGGATGNTGGPAPAGSSASGGAGGVGSSGQINSNGNGGGGSIFTASFGVSGNGGASMIGGGAAGFGASGGPSSNAGNAGQAYGGGASGAARTAIGPVNGGTTTGASGAAGVVIIEEFY